MKNNNRTLVGRWTLIATTLCLVLIAQPAWAYLDPGTGSMMISAIVGLFATAGLVVKTYWYKLKAFLRKDMAEGLINDDASVDSESPADR